MKSKIRLGILGGGGDSLIGIVHRIASSMHDKYSIIGGVFNPDYSENVKFAKEIGLDESRVYEDYDKMIQEELNIVPTSLKEWLQVKLENQNKKRNTWSRQWESSQWKLQWDK